MEISKETYANADVETKSSLTFDLLLSLHDKMDDLKRCYEDHKGICDGRFKGLENQKKVNTVLSAGGGVIGGIIAYFSSLWGGK